MLSQKKSWQLCYGSLQQRAQKHEEEGTAPAEFIAHVDDFGFHLHNILGGQWWKRDG